MTDTRIHNEAEVLLPWYVTDRLDAAERTIVETHLAECEACRAALASERALAGLVKAAPVREPSADAGWAALSRRIATPPPVRRAAPRPWQRLARAAARPRTLGWAVAAQFLLVLGLAGALVAERRPDAYRALGDGTEARAGNALVMFEPDVSESRLRGALQASHARLVDGPTVANAYVVELPRAELTPGLARLRRTPGVTMAEPIDQAVAE